LVHVSLLTEGVNLPWVRCVALRVLQGSRVRFAQYVGRALRRSRGKSKAVLLDPRGLMQTHRLTYEAALWEQDEEDSAQPSPQDGLRAQVAEVLRELRKSPFPLPISPIPEARARYLVKQGRLDPTLSGLVEAWLEAGLVQDAWEAAERGARNGINHALRRILVGG
jgi:superfamily II DNA or RNA helicase